MLRDTAVKFRRERDQLEGALLATITGTHLAAGVQKWGGMGLPLVDGRDGRLPSRKNYRA